MARPAKRGDSSFEASYTLADTLMLQSLSRPEPEPGLVSKTLRDHPIFVGCDECELFENIDLQAQRFLLDPGEQLELHDDAPLLIVEQGAVQVSVGSGAPRLLGPGTVLNVLGLLKIRHESDPFKPRASQVGEGGGDANAMAEMVASVREASAKASGFVGAYEISGDKRLPPNLFADRRRGARTNNTIKPGEVSPDDLVCFYNLCPNAAGSGPAPGGRQLDDWLPMRVTGGAEGGVPRSTSEAADRFQTGGAVLCAVPMKLLEALCWDVDGVLNGDECQTMREVHDIFKSNSERLADVWRGIMSRCNTIFPGVPPDVIWAIAEGSHRVEVEAGTTFVAEGDDGESSQAVILIDTGLAMVEKAVANGDGAPPDVPIGKLGPGAIIGDLCLHSSGMVRPASVRAIAFTEAIVVPAAALAAAVENFPGLLTSLEHRLKEVGAFLTHRLPVRLEALASLRLFAGCDAAFLNHMANMSERHMNYAGSIVAQPAPDAPDAGMLYVVEYGQCVMQADGSSEATVVEMGTCFGGETFFGVGDALGKTVRAAAPITVTLAIPELAISEAVLRYYKGHSPFDKAMPLPSDYLVTKLLSGVSIFEGCRKSFMQELADRAVFRSYLAGQSICVNGAKQNLRLVVLRGGLTATEKQKEGEGDEGIVTTDKTWNSFGELGMLGAARKWHQTVRALSLCFTLEISREAFVSIVERHPEERARFEEVAVRALTSQPDEVDECRWPMFAGAPTRMRYLVDLLSDRHVYPAFGNCELIDHQGAVLVVEGTASVMSKEGVEVEALEAGQCFHESALLGTDGRSGCYVVPHPGSEIQVMTREVFNEVVSGCLKSVLRSIEDNTRTFMASEAAKKMGFSLADPQLLRCSSLMKTLSLGLGAELAKRIEAVVVQKGDIIIEEGKVGGKMYILLEGSGYSESNGRITTIKAGKALGEAVLAGVSTVYSRTVIASELCILISLKKSAVVELLGSFKEDNDILGKLVVGAKKVGGGTLKDKIRRSDVFADSPDSFVSMLSTQTEDAFFAGGEVIVQCGDECVFGQTHLFLLLSGVAISETDLGVQLARMGPGDFIGEGGAFGITKKRLYTLRAAPGGSCHCAVIVGPAIEAALNKHPEQLGKFQAQFEQKCDRNQDRFVERKVWLEEEVVPALERCAVFAGYPREFLEDLARPLLAKEFAGGSTIVAAGEPADSMLVLLEGSAVVESSKGTKLGSLLAGGAVGEVAALGLLPTRPITLRAVARCRVLVVAAGALRRAVDNASEEVKATFSMVLDSRQDAVARGFPMTAMNIGVKKDSLATRAIALQAMPLSLLPGQVLEPLPEDDPNGQHFIVLVKGKAVLEMPMWPPEPGATARASKIAGESNAVEVMTVTLGYPLFEGMAAEFCTQVRAETACEGFRVRLTDFAASALLVEKLEWMPRFRMLEGEAKRTLDRRCSAARGVVEGLAPHPSDADIHEWRSRRLSAIERVKSLKLHTLSSPCITPLGASPAKLAADLLRARTHPDHAGRRQNTASPASSPNGDAHPAKMNRRMVACLEAITPISPAAADPKGRRAVTLGSSPSGASLEPLARRPAPADAVDDGMGAPLSGRAASPPEFQRSRGTPTLAPEPQSSKTTTPTIERVRVVEKTKAKPISASAAPKAPVTPILPVKPPEPPAPSDRKKEKKQRRPRDQEYYEEKQRRREERQEKERRSMGLAPTSEAKPRGPSNIPAEVKGLFGEWHEPENPGANAQLTSLPKLGYAPRQN